MKRKRPETYEVTREDGSKVRVTVPENDEQELFDAMREQLSAPTTATWTGRSIGSPMSL